jgi:hypothetical protein
MVAKSLYGEAVAAKALCGVRVPFDEMRSVLSNYVKELTKLQEGHSLG